MIAEDLNIFIQAATKLPAELFFAKDGNHSILFQEDSGDPDEYYVYIMKKNHNGEDQKYHAIRVTKYQTPEQIILNVDEGVKEFVRKMNER